MDFMIMIMGKRGSLGSLCISWLKISIAVHSVTDEKTKRLQNYTESQNA